MIVIVITILQQHYDGDGSTTTIIINDTFIAKYEVEMVASE